MIEQILEQKIIDKLGAILDGSNIQIIGAWQMTDDVNRPKNFEDDTYVGYLVVKMWPRSYETPTIPTTRLQATISLVMRSDADANGCNFLNISESISDVLQGWQKSLTDVIADFEIDDKFGVSGFQINGGDISSDKENHVWQFSQTVTLFGVVL